MKKILALLLAMVLMLSCFAGCASEPENNEPDNNEQGNSAPQYDVISIEKALELCGEAGNVTTEKYYIRGTVESITNPTYGAMVITDGTHSISVYNTAGYAYM